jgi:hypothetical protein
MENETRVKALHSLIPLWDFKALLGVDDRDDKTSIFCLTTATYTIEHYCKRRLVLKRHFERVELSGDLLLTLGEYPVREVLAVYGLSGIGGTGEPLEPDLYEVIPGLEEEPGEAPEDCRYSLVLSQALRYKPGYEAYKVVYRAGYACGEAPADLASACFELAAWNMARYRGKRIGITGNVRGSGRDGEHLEASMPENVRLLLEPYIRRVI